MVCGRLSFAFDQDGKLDEVPAVPPWKRLEELESLAIRQNVHGHALPVFGRGLVPFPAPGEAVPRQLLALGRSEPEGGAVGGFQRILDRIELEGPREGQGCHDLRTGQKRERRGAAVVPTGEVPVERADDGVGLVLPHVSPLPLADARAARVSQHRPAHPLEDLQQPVALDRVVNPLRARRDEERNLRSESRLEPLHGDVGRAAHVLVRGVGARADERRFQVRRPPVLPNLSRELRDLATPVGRVGADDLRLQRREIQLHKLVEEPVRVPLRLRISHEVLPVLLGQRCGLGPARRAEVGGHAVVERKDRSRSAQLGSHVADRGLARRADGLGSRAEVFEDLVRATLDGQEATEVGNHVFGSCPSGESAGQPDSNKLGVEHLPREASHDLSAVCPPHPDGQHPEPAAVGGVRVRTDHEPARKCVVLEHDLVNDARAGLPEADLILP